MRISQRQTTKTIPPPQRHPNRPAGLTLLELIIVVVIIGILFALILPFTRGSGGREAARRSQCKNNLKQIMLAMHNYLEEHGSFPPPYTVDETGQRLHSWRTLILPYLDQRALYETIDLTKPWNHPANAQAFATQVQCYQCPSAELPETSTTYMGIVGPDAFFHPEQTRRFADFTDSLSETLAIVEVPAANGVPWMSPFDTTAEFLMSIDPDSGLSHTGGFQFGMVDGSVHFLNAEQSPASRKALTTVAGDDNAPDFP